MDIYAEASATAVALVRAAALGHRRRDDDRDPGQIVCGYVEAACLAQGLTDTAKPMALFVGGLPQLGGCAVLGLHVQATGQGYDEIDPDQLRGQLDKWSCVSWPGEGSGVLTEAARAAAGPLGAAGVRALRRQAVCAHPGRGVCLQRLRLSEWRGGKRVHYSGGDIQASDARGFYRHAAIVDKPFLRGLDALEDRRRLS